MRARSLATAALALGALAAAAGCKSQPGTVNLTLVADASLFPTPVRVNPMETIMALATRSAGYVIDNARRFFQ